MDIDKVFNLAARFLFFVATAMLVAAFIKLVFGMFGYTFLGADYTAGRFIELSGSLLVFVVVILLRQIRNALGTPGTGANDN